MRGFVPTPTATVDTMVDLLFRRQPPKPDSTILDPGCGTGEFIDGVVRWFHARKLPTPRITGIEVDPRHMPALKAKYKHLRSVRIVNADFLSDDKAVYDYVVGNPPYIPITDLSQVEKTRYRKRYLSARGRFDLYLLFFEEALRRLAASGRLVFITPEKYLYVDTAGPLRELLARFHVEEIRLVREDTFGELVTYPTITVIKNAQPSATLIVRRDGGATSVSLPTGRDSWLPWFDGEPVSARTLTLGDLCVRLSCGVATGADSVFVHSIDDLDPDLRPFSYPTIAGRDLTSTSDLEARSAMLVPYDVNGGLIPWGRLGKLRYFLNRKDIRQRLLARTCVKRKPWYAFHETPPLKDILRPKILCKDIGETPQFWVDRSGKIVPRHSVYYIVPRDPEAVERIVAYLRTPFARKWLSQNCQRAAKGFIRLQSHVLQRLPVPEDLASEAAPPESGRKAHSSKFEIPSEPDIARAA